MSDITITLAAQEQISKLCSENNKIVRLSIDAGGCQGFSKVWSISDNIIGDEDNTFDFESSGRLVIDNMSLDILYNATIDYKKDFAGSYFVVDIPSSTNQCGCGTSFSI